MSFGDISSRFKKKQEESAPPEPAQRDHAEVYAIRARILGVLLRDARLANDVDEDNLAQAINVAVEQIQVWEFGQEAPSLPQLEMIAYYLGVPVSHFWSQKTLSTEKEERHIPEGQYSELRDRVIGAKLIMARQEAKLSREELAEAIGLTPDLISAYEFGSVPIPFPELASLTSAVRKPMAYFLEDSNRVGNWLSIQEEYRRFSELPEELRAFVSQPVNQPFIDIALRLSKLQVHELRAVGENILNITF